MPGLLDSQTLLSPQEEGFARQQAMMNAAGALMKGARYSAIPVSPFETLGEGLQGYTQGYNGAADQLMKRELLHSTIDQRRLSAIQAIAQYAGLGLPIPPLLKQMAGGADAVGGFGGSGGAPAPGMPAPGGGMPPPAYGGAAPPQPGGPGAPPNALPSGLLSPNLVGGAPPPLSGGGMPAPAPAQGAPAAPGGGMPPQAGGPLGIPDVNNIIRTLPAPTRYSLAVKGPAGEIAKDLITKTLTPSDLQKNTAASGKASPFQYESDLANSKFSRGGKDAASAGFLTPDGQPDVPAYTNWLEQNKAVAAAQGKHIGSYVEGMEPNRQAVDSLNTMEDALKAGGNNIRTGPYADQWLKLKQAANDLAPGLFKGVPESEVMSKMGVWLGSQATRALGSREASQVLQQQIRANPGIQTSPEGAMKLIDIVRQAKQRDLALGEKAQDPANLKNWANVEKEHFAKNPIISPFTNTPLGTGFKPPAGWQFSRKAMQYRDPSGKLYDVTGAPVQ